eukprot:m.902197 g.902197  ORF g.902197 m.902197 type:complete len:83 (+) comp23689_c3_seq38:1050-1298(+)
MANVRSSQSGLHGKFEACEAIGTQHQYVEECVHHLTYRLFLQFHPSQCTDRCCFRNPTQGRVLGCATTACRPTLATSSSNLG